MEEDFVMVETSQEASVPVVNGTNHLDFISKYTDEHSSGLRQLSLAIHDNPELGYKEHHAHKVLTEFLDEQGYWTVTRSAYEINTAFVAVYESKEKAGEKKPAVVSFNVEYGGYVRRVVVRTCLMSTQTPYRVLDMPAAIISSPSHHSQARWLLRL